MSEVNQPTYSEEVQALVDGEVIIYPTEAVWGIGCDPSNEAAVNKLLKLKQRPVEKGVILIAKDYSQVLPYVADDRIPMDKRADIFSRWPGPVTWLLPASDNAPKWITGGSELIAVRVTTHPTVRRICEEFKGPIVSTSANITGQPTPSTVTELKQIFKDGVKSYVDETLGKTSQPSTIINGMTGQVIRN